MDQGSGARGRGRIANPANIYKRGEVWWGRVKLAGREYRVSLRTSDRREAAKRFKAWRAKLDKQRLGIADAPTFKEVVVKWATEVLPEAVKPAVARRYLSSVNQLDTVFGTMRIDQITSSRIGDYIAARRKEATNATIRRDLTALSRLLAACVAWEYCEENPARAFDRSIIRERRDPIEPPSPPDVETLLAACPPGMAAVLRLLAETGMREAEALTLEAHQVDWQARTITLTRTKTSRPRTITWATPGGDAGRVLAPLSGRSGLLLRSSTGDGYEVRSFSGGVGRIMRETVEREKQARREFRRFRVHDLRHAFAIRWLRSGGGVYELARHLGHTSVKTTETVYLGFLTTEQGRAATQRDAHISGHSPDTDDRMSGVLRKD